MGISQGPSILSVTVLLVWTKFSVPHQSLAKVLSTTQLFPNLIHLLLPRAMDKLSEPLFLIPLVL